MLPLYFLGTATLGLSLTASHLNLCQFGCFEHVYFQSFEWIISFEIIFYQFDSIGYEIAVFDVNSPDSEKLFTRSLSLTGFVVSRGLEIQVGIHGVSYKAAYMYLSLSILTVVSRYLCFLGWTYV